MKIKLLFVVLCAFPFFPASAVNFANWYNAHIMGFYLNGSFIEMNAQRIAAWKYVSDHLKPEDEFNLQNVWENTDFPDYEFKCGTTVEQGNRFWVISGEGTIENKKWQPMTTVLTGTVGENGTITGVKKVRPLPFPVKLGRALLYGNKIWYLGGEGHDELVAADILEDGELGEWKNYKNYPVNVYGGGFVYYKGCFYANGQATASKKGSDKMYALEVKENGVGQKWVRVDSPRNAMGRLYVHNDTLYFFDEVSGIIYKTTQDEDGIQLKEWQSAGRMPCPPNSEGVGITQVPDGWFIYGGILRKDSDFAGFYRGSFMPFSDLK